MKKINNSGQITIFIIVGIVLVVGIVFAFFFFGDLSIITSAKTSPVDYITSCVQDAVLASSEKIYPGGGQISPEFFIMYRGDKHNYLCYQKNNYKSCVIQIPMLKEVIESQIELDSMEKIKQCFSSFKTEMEKQNYVVSESELNYSIQIISKKILIKINKNIQISKDSSEGFGKFDTFVLSPIFELQTIATEIMTQESVYCNFDYNGFMALYPDYDIKRISYDNSRIYQVKDRRSGKQFNFAVRSCAYPAGL